MTTQVHCRHRAWFNACGNHNGRQRYFCSPFYVPRALPLVDPSVRPPAGFFYRLQIPPCVRGCRKKRNLFIGVREMLLRQKYPLQICKYHLRACFKVVKLAATQSDASDNFMTEATSMIQVPSLAAPNE